ncbi:hypothetical protein EKH57_12135 [Halorubrum sp. BOL3-1]|uniref:DUF7857 domain-containing protein n=1 Tax=Halorubrum sp. BOL3-1 TaxID=2497325 RepID=UPI0010050C09|nr:hypothetical protein [Halorubrum sp. BOL3-1]QAU13402.1 hypothetical protein EKH57_12135 [Halorubrum sp. BOL3-1]
MELDWSVEREGDASLVGFRVRNDGAVPRRVRIESRIDGPVLPPRRGGVTEAGWDATGVTTVIDPGETEAFGYAALADRVEPPVEIVDVESVDSGEKSARAAEEGGDSPARAAVRSLEDHRPPRRAVAGARGVDRDDGPSGGDAERVGPTDETDSKECEPTDETDTERVEPTDETDADGSTAAEPATSAASRAEIDAWFATVETRIDRAERLTGADLATATTVVEAVGGLDSVEGLDERVAADAECLRAIRDRAAALAERAEATDISTEALEALA